MKVISIGTDRKILEEGSAVRQRMVEYGKLFDELHIVIFSLKTPGASVNVQISENVYAHPTNSKSKALYIIDAVRIAEKIMQEKNKEGVVVTVQDPFETGLVGLVLKLRYKLPLQVQIHTDFHNRFFILHSPLNFMRFFVAQVVLSFADSARAVSLRIAKSIKSLCENVNVLPIYTSSPKVEDRKPQVKSNDKLSILTVARLEKEKDMATTIKAFAKIIHEGINAELVIVGDGSQRKKLEHLSLVSNLQSHISFVGWQNDVTPFYEKADVYVSSSLYEGYGMSVVEAAKYDCALVLSDTGVAGEIFKDGESALVCKQGFVEKFALAFRLLAKNKSYTEQLGGKALEAAKVTDIEPEEYKRRYKESLTKAVEYFNLEKSIFSRNILLRYLVAGITAASSNILLFYLFTYPLSINYLYSSVYAYWLSFVVSFALQKFWTFRDKSISKAHHQFIKYAIVVFVGVIVNTLCMYIFVSLFRIWPVLAQVLTGAVIAVFNFFAYKTFIFK
jgi:glycosyltransferase involved in cell wall biosynthesis/putative flippase GtrA